MTEQELNELKATVVEAEKYLGNEKELAELREQLLQVNINSAFLQFESDRKIEIRLTDGNGNKLANITDYLNYDGLLTIHTDLCRFFAQRIAYFKQQREQIKFYKRRPYKK
nr:hypothetical protein [uncultured Prevotella sp.]